MANPAFTLESREKGQLPISIASSLAIESALGIMESDEPGYKPPASPPLLDYDAIWINLRTLFRNLHGSMNRVDADKVHINKFITSVKKPIVIVFHTDNRQQELHQKQTYSS